MKKYKNKGLKLSTVLKQCGISKSSYYYKNKKGKQGRRPSTHTLGADGSLVRNEEVLNYIKDILNSPFVDFGYLKMTHRLRQTKFLTINHKKVYRLMKKSNLLQVVEKKPKLSRRRVSGWKVDVSRPFELIEIDIKYIYVQGDGRSYYMLNLLDCYTWKLLSYRVAASIRKEDVIKLLQRVFALHGYPEYVTLRSDNGSQFISKDVAVYVEDVGISHEFCHVATPQENGHVECFHSILDRFLRKRGHFNSFFELEQVMRNWTQFYNEERPHKGCGYKTPNMVMSEYYEKLRKNVGKNAA